MHKPGSATAILQPASGYLSTSSAAAWARPSESTRVGCSRRVAQAWVLGNVTGKTLLSRMSTANNHAKTISVADVVCLAETSGLELLADHRGNGFVTIPDKGWVWRLTDRRFSQWLTNRVFDKYGDAPTAVVLREAVAVLAGKAMERVTVSANDRSMSALKADPFAELFVEFAYDRAASIGQACNPQEILAADLATMLFKFASRRGMARRPDWPKGIVGLGRWLNREPTRRLIRIFGVKAEARHKRAGTSYTIMVTPQSPDGDSCTVDLSRDVSLVNSPAATTCRVGDGLTDESDDQAMFDRIAQKRKEAPHALSPNLPFDLKLQTGPLE